MEPLFTARPGGMRVLNAVLAALIGLDVVLAVILLVFANVSAALVTFGTMLLTVAIIWVILPKRYEVWPAHLRIVFPMWGWNIDYAGIETVREAAALESYAFIGVRFATAPSQAVTILRRNPNLFTHPNVVISPEDREEFMRHLQRAMRS